MIFKIGNEAEDFCERAVNDRAYFKTDQLNLSFLLI